MTGENNDKYKKLKELSYKMEVWEIVEYWSYLLFGKGYFALV